jgi:hypothetical protein
MHHQPLPTEVRQYIATSILGGHYARAVEACGKEAGMTSADEDLWHRLSDPQSPEFILDQPDYYCVATALLALGVRPT